MQACSTCNHGIIKPASRRGRRNSCCLVFPTLRLPTDCLCSVLCRLLCSRRGIFTVFSHRVLQVRCDLLRVVRRLLQSVLVSLEGICGI